jgi:hypothetical protein
VRLLSAVLGPVLLVGTMINVVRTLILPRGLGSRLAQWLWWFWRAALRRLGSNCRYETRDRALAWLGPREPSWGPELLASRYPAVSMLRTSRRNRLSWIFSEDAFHHHRATGRTDHGHSMRDSGGPGPARRRRDGVSARPAPCLHLSDRVTVGYTGAADAPCGRGRTTHGKPAHGRFHGRALLALL